MSAKLTKDEVARAKAEIRERAMEFAQKVQPIFEANKWTWTNKDGIAVPNVDDIFFLIMSMVGELKHGNEMFSVSSGRISVSISKYHETGDIGCFIELVPFCVIGHTKTDELKKAG